MTITKDNLTDLVLYGIGIPPYSARGLSTTLTPIGQAAVLKRTINGELDDLSDSVFRKYRLTITCTDQQAPSFDGIFPGAVVTVDFPQELAYSEYHPGPGRAIVPGSERQANGFNFYRPRFVCRVVTHNVASPEWDASYAWTLDLEEI